METNRANGDPDYLGDGRRLVQHPRAKHGLLVGLIDRPAIGIECSVWASALPLWIPAASALGFSVTSLSLGRVAHRAYAAFVGRHYPSIRLDAQAKRYSASSQVVLVDDRRMTPSPDHYFWHRTKMLVVSTVGSMRPTWSSLPVGWNHDTVALGHADLGGVTTAEGFLTVIRRQPITVVPVPAFPPASMALILSDVIYGRSHSAIPEPSTPMSRPLLVGQEGTSPKYSAYGLLPHTDPRVLVVAPSVFSGVNMVCRQLTMDEMAKAWDLPTIFIDEMGSEELKFFVSEASGVLPTRILHEGLRAIWKGAGGVRSPEEAITRSPKRSAEKRKTVGTDRVESRRLEAKRGKTSPSSPSVSTISTVSTLASSTSLAVVEPSTVSASPIPSADPRSSVAPQSPLTSVPLPSACSTFTEGITEETELAQEPSVKAGAGEAHLAAKHDDAKVPTWIWNEASRRLWKEEWGNVPQPDQLEALCVALRKGSLHWWKCSVRQDFWKWFRSQSVEPRQGSSMVRWDPGSGRYVWVKRGPKSYAQAHYRLRQNPNFDAGADCLRRVANSSWWEWEDGSRILFWRWKGRERIMRDGQPHRLTGDLPSFRRRQNKPKDRAGVVRKITKVRERDYLIQGVTVLSLIHMFDVPKGTNDIRLVYNGTSSGLNRSLYGPHFTLPTVDTTLRALEQGSLSADIDIAEMFLNFMLDPKLRPYCGVDVSAIRSEDGSFEKGRKSTWEAWCRLWMGQTDSPYLAVQCMLWAEEIILGARGDESNPFQWARIELNLPGDKNYDPSKPWVAKVRHDDHLAADVFLYVDDARTVGHNFEACWRATRRYASMCNWLGIQDAARKRTMPSMTPGPWAGTMVDCATGLDGTVTQAKWTKGRDQVQEIAVMIQANPAAMPRERLEQIRGFLVYLCRTYPDMVPYLKGIHLTLDGWRAGRDYAGWKLSGRALLAAMAEGKVSMEQPDEAPTNVAAVERLGSDVRALTYLMQSESPPSRPLRAKRRMVGLIIGDASGEAKGALLCRGAKIEYVTAEWTDSAKGQSSNWREATNLVDRIEELSKEEQAWDMEVITLTDNEVFERTFWKGSSTNEKLHETILRLRKISLTRRLRTLVYHISGERMKRIGVDGLSRGDMYEGVLAGGDPLDYVPFNEGANARSEGRVEEWVKTWWGPFTLRTLTPEGWFEAAHGSAPCLWMPPPAAMAVALEQFAKARHKRPEVPHVFVVPRLMTGHWRKELSKDADVLFTVRVGVSFWSSSQCEPLIVAIALPFVTRRVSPESWRGPWVVRGSCLASELHQDLARVVGPPRKGSSDQPDDLGGDVRQPSLREGTEKRAGNILRKFLERARAIPSLPEGVVREMLRPHEWRNVPKEGAGRGGGR